MWISSRTGYAGYSLFVANNADNFLQNQELAPEVGLEPTTTRLTAACSTIELLWIAKGRVIYRPPSSRSNRFHRVFWQRGQKNVLRAACVMRLILLPQRKHGLPARS